MVDIHCHILPGFDDGAADLREALAMIRTALDCGVTGIVVTPHFRGEEDFLPALEEIYRRYSRLEQAAAREGLDIQLYPGAEVLCLEQTGELARKRLLPTLGDTGYVLTEFFFDTSFREMDRMLSEIAGAGYIPVVAHPERYDTIVLDPRGVEDWFARGYVIQLNKGSVLGAFGYRIQKTAEWLLDVGLVHVIASDAHGAQRRTTDMTLLAQRLRRHHPESYVRALLQYNPQRLVRGLPMLPAETL